MKRLKWFVGLLVLTVMGLVLTTPNTAHAQTINYRSLVYGTNKNSMASPYFVKPASVKVVDHQYVVTMHVRTQKKLSSFPVKMIWVNGQTPQNVRCVKDRAGNSNLFYSFTTTNLSKRVNAKLAVDVPGVYKAKHMITFKFSTVGLPSLKGNATSRSTAKTQATKQPKSVTSRAKSVTSHKQPVTHHSTKQSPKAKQTSHKQAAAQASSQDSSSKPSEASSQASSSTHTTSADKQDHSNDHSRIAFLIAGVVVIIVVVLGGSLVVMRKKR